MPFIWACSADVASADAEGVLGAELARVLVLLGAEASATKLADRRAVVTRAAHIAGCVVAIRA